MQKEALSACKLCFRNLCAGHFLCPWFPMSKVDPCPLTSKILRFELLSDGLIGLNSNTGLL